MVTSTKGRTATKPAATKARTGAKAMNEKAMARAIASATKKLPGVTLDTARATYAGNAVREHGSCVTYAMALNERFGKVLTDHRIHWTEIANSANAKAPDSNYHPIWKAIEAERVELETLMKGKHSNIPQVWKRAKEKAFQIACPGKQRERDHVVPSAKAEKALKALYKSLMKESMPTDLDIKVADAIGRILIASFKIDLSTLDV